jgi:cell division protein FtsQ
VAAEQGFYDLTLRAGLSVENVLVEGRRRSKRSAVIEALGVARGVPILRLDPHAAKTRLEGLPWVYRASVVRRLPETVYVRLIEREPLALWQNNGELAVIDRSGGIIPGAEAGRFAKLPLVVGEDAADHAAELLAMLAKEPVLKAKVAAAVRVRGRRWNVRLDGGIDVRLPEEGAAAAWAQLARIQREHGVLERDVVLIDLRMPDRLVVRTAPGATDKDGAAGSGKDT